MFLGSFKKGEKIASLGNLNGDLRERSKSLLLKKKLEKENQLISSHCHDYLKR